MPTEHTSDLKRGQGVITKAGPERARRLLVEAAHDYRRTPAIGQILNRRQDGQDPRAIEIAWRAQRRLYDRWQHLRGERKKPAGAVAIAVARELAGFLLEAATLEFSLTDPSDRARDAVGARMSSQEGPGPVAGGSRLNYGQPAPAGLARCWTASRDEDRVLR